MTISRRGLLKALGLGGVGLAVGAGGKLFGQDVFGEETCLAGEPTEDGSLSGLDFDKLKATSGASEWVHPDLDKIDAILKLTGGYPTMFARFNCGDVHVNNGDRLKLNYTISGHFSDSVVLHRVYDCVMTLSVLGTSIQGPVIVDADAPDGHRLATIEELVPNEEASIRAYIDNHKV